MHSERGVLLLKNQFNLKRRYNVNVYIYKAPPPPPCARIFFARIPKSICQTRSYIYLNCNRIRGQYYRDIYGFSVSTGYTPTYIFYMYVLNIRTDGERERRGREREREPTSSSSSSSSFRSRIISFCGNRQSRTYLEFSGTRLIG